MDAPTTKPVPDTGQRLGLSSYSCNRPSELATCVVIGAGGHGRELADIIRCLLYTSPSPRDRTRSRMPSSA